jgi:hypothetical protein
MKKCLQLLTVAALALIIGYSYGRRMRPKEWNPQPTLGPIQKVIPLEDNGPNILKHSPADIGADLPAGNQLNYSAQVSRTNAENVIARRRLTIRDVQRTEGWMVSQLNLDPETSAKLLTILVDRSLATQDVQHIIAEQGVDDPRSRASALSAAVSGNNDEIRGLIGAQKTDDLMKLMDLGEKVDTINSTLSLDMDFSGQPLTISQKIALAKVMNEVHYSPAAVLSDTITGVLGLQGMRNPKEKELFFDSASSILSPDQLTVLRASDSDKVAEETLLDNSLAVGIHKAKVGQAN